MPALAIALMASLALLQVSCGSATLEEQLLTSFFRAARLHDKTVLANIATVDFNPRADGIVERFEIVSRSEEQGRKRVTVNAQVRTPDGHTVPRTMVFTLETRDGRWVITALQQES